LRKAPAEAGFSAARQVSRGQAPGLSPDALNKLMQVPAEKLPAYVVAGLPGGTQAVIWVVDSKLPDKQDPALFEQLRRSIERQFGAADDLAYVEELKRKFKAEVIGLERGASGKK